MNHWRLPTGDVHGVTGLAPTCVSIKYGGAGGVSINWTTAAMKSPFTCLDGNCNINTL
eukprot:m.1661171 g.1661171  ORF g.1661171 m.1661171 type:complete len:58 (-) comp124124_c0_seq1:67-240(-)